MTEISNGIISGVSLAAVFGIWRWSCGKFKRHTSENDANKQGTRALLKDRMTQTYYFYKSKGHIPMYVRENWLTMYNAYKALGGNGNMDKLKEKILNMNEKE